MLIEDRDHERPRQVLMTARAEDPEGRQASAQIRPAARRLSGRRSPRVWFA